MALSLYFAQNVDSVIVSECARHLVIVHRQVILLNAPKFGQAGRIDDLEHTRLFVFPSDVRSVALRRIVQELLQEVPQETPVGVELGRLLFHRGRGRWHHVLRTARASGVRRLFEMLLI